MPSTTQLLDARFAALNSIQFAPAGSPSWSEGSVGTDTKPCERTMIIDDDRCHTANHAADSEDELGSDDELGGGVEEAANERGGASRKGAGKLWTKKQFPEGTTGAANWDMANLVAAQEWTCPCSDRRNCIGSERLPKVLDLYEHRKQFQTTCSSNGGGKRDVARVSMSQHYSQGSGTMSRSFVVGSLNDCCASSAGLASGLSFGTWARARADLGSDAPLRPARRKAAGERESNERRHLEAYIRDLRSSMEGSKGKAAVNQWFTGRRTMPQRWEDYRKHRLDKKLPIIGSVHLFTKLWKAHDEIMELKATGHEVCDDCGKNQAERDRYEGRTDNHAIAERKRIDDKQAVHDREHRGERHYANDIWHKSETYPDRVTALNMDAPTQDEFDVPVQPRSFRDSVKSLNGLQKWSSKITGVMAAGHGMIAYVTSKGLCSGPNLSLTLLYLTLMRIAASQRGLGSRFSLLADGTASDNKNNEMLIFLCWLVYLDIFQDASMFVMIKGHTFTILDQSFNTMIAQLMRVAVYTISSLMAHMWKFIAPYNCLDVMELNHLWDWKEFFKPHVTRLGGFCTSQYGTGMHEFYARKDREGVVRIWMRASSQASSWLPEGPGYQVFETVPKGRPSLASAQSDEVWGRLEVEGTIRQWIPYMTTESPEHAAQIRTEWERRFNQLPAGGNTDLLPPELKLTWVDLPRRSNVAAAAGDAHGGGGVTGNLENPDVNPITGNGRTAADVQHDLERHRANVRANATVDVPAIFQADYLFLQLPGCDLALHRVVHGLIIDDATCPDLAFTSTEYVHVPQPDVSGFWGTFGLKANSVYDPKDARKGTKFIRHHHVGRAVIRLYGVETFTTKEKMADGGGVTTVLRVKASSLERLSKVCPGWQMPSTLPQTHTGVEAQRKRHRSGAGAGKGGGRRARGALDAAEEDDDVEVEEVEAGEEEEAEAAEEEAAEEEEEDPPAPIPAGFTRAADWVNGRPLMNFMLWAAVDGAVKASWHTGIVSKVLPRSGGKERRDGFTHDAKLDGSTSVRGVTLSPTLYAEGMWLPIVKLYHACYSPRELPDELGTIMMNWIDKLPTPAGVEPTEAATLNSSTVEALFRQRVDVDALVGFAAHSPCAETEFLLLDEIHVRDGWQQQGLGTKLLDRVKQVASEHKGHMRLTASNDAEGATRFYQQAGLMAVHVPRASYKYFEWHSVG